jgi:hypothetical protein
MAVTPYIDPVQSVPGEHSRILELYGQDSPRASGRIYPDRDIQPGIRNLEEVSGENARRTYKRTETGPEEDFSGNSGWKSYRALAGWMYEREDDGEYNPLRYPQSEYSRMSRIDRDMQYQQGKFLDFLA